MFSMNIFVLPKNVKQVAVISLPLLSEDGL
jgi:hypothetical protein